MQKLVSRRCFQSAATIATTSRLRVGGCAVDGDSHRGGIGSPGRVFEERLSVGRTGSSRADVSSGERRQGVGGVISGHPSTRYTGRVYVLRRVGGAAEGHARHRVSGENAREGGRAASREGWSLALLRHRAATCDP